MNSPVTSQSFSLEAQDLLEGKILKNIMEKTKEAFGSDAVEISPSDARHSAVTEYVAKVVQEFPTCQQGNRYINCFVCTIPTLLVKVNRLQPIFDEAEKESIFPTKIGDKMTVIPLVAPLWGPITEEEQELQISNVRCKDTAFRANEMTIEKLQSQKIQEGSAVYNKTVLSGTYNIDPTLQKATLIADIRFGDREYKDKEIEVSTSLSDQSITYSIPMEDLRVGGKIRYDGVIKLSNGTTIEVKDLPSIGLDLGTDAVHISSVVNNSVPFLV